MALTDQLTAIGNAIRAKTGGSALIPLNDMPSEIASISSGGAPSSALTITGNCDYMFNNGKWDWFITMYGGQITTSNITGGSYMFRETSVAIPFSIELNTSNASYLFSRYNGTTSPNVSFVSSNKSVDLTGMFTSARIDSFGTFTVTGSNLIPQNMSGMFEDCHNITTLPVAFLSSLDYSTIHSYTGKNLFSFVSDYNLRSIPKSILKELYNSANKATNSPSNARFSACYCLDEIDGLNSPPNVAYTANMHSSAFNNCYRLKKMVYLTDENNNNAPLVRNWKGQVFDFSVNVGYLPPTSRNLFLSAVKLTTATEVTDATSYNLLKNDPDWWTDDVAYSRYNHDSAVETINSLPDTSSSGGTNTIKFTGAAGSSTDGGAISTLTAAEIAVATAKGWTVTLV